jgi:DNA repair protein RadD
MNVLTTGFDAPNVDCVAILRPTLSPGLYLQMVGRGCRLSPGKDECLILDFGENILRHGPIDAIRVQEVASRMNGNGKGNGKPAAKECPECHSVIAIGYSNCPDCNYVFPEPDDESQHEARASDEDILSGKVTTTEYEVFGVLYEVHHKRGAPDDAPKTFRVDYQIGLYQYQSEWICFEHSGWARSKAESWWRKRSNAPVPDTAAEARDFAQDGALCKTKSVTVRSVEGEKYDSIVAYELDGQPSWREPGWDDDEDWAPPQPTSVLGLDEDEVPF